MQGYNMSLEPGFCTALNKGMLVCPDDTSTPTNFTSFLTPPVNDDEDEEDNANLLKLAVQEKYDNSDLILLTKMSISIAMKTPELKHHMKNIAGVAGRILGQHSIAHKSLKGVAAHIEKKETSYNYEFRQEKLFGGNFMDKVIGAYIGSLILVHLETSPRLIQPTLISRTCLNKLNAVNITRRFQLGSGS